jgi:hypothetical protein
MSKENETPEVKKVDTPAPALTMEQLFKMFLDTQKENAANQRLLAEALTESRKPYIDPNVLKQQQADAEERRRMTEMVARQKVANKVNCPHLRENETSRIQWHEHSNGITMGFCSDCGSEFDTRNHEDLKLLRSNLKAIKSMGRAGAHSNTKRLAL